MDLKHIPFFDNHTHTLDYSDRHLDPDASVGLLDHGFREELHPEKGYPCSLEGSPELKYHIRHLAPSRPSSTSMPSTWAARKTWT